MPIQNVGTLLENLVVTEASVALLRLCNETAPFEFVNSFAMPPLSRWRPHSQNAGFDPVALERVRSATESSLPEGPSYPALLRACLRSGADFGPNAALLVAGASLKVGVPCRMWLNDIHEGHYGDAIPMLKEIAVLAGAIGGINRAVQEGLSVCVSDVKYPESIVELARVLREWCPPAGARVGFLDPMRYRIQDRGDAETSSEDHRLWLRQIAFEGIACAVQFTGHSDHPSLERELLSLHEDAIAEGYVASRAFKRQHYVVFLAIRSARLNSQAEQVATEIEGRVCRAWAFWGRAFTSSHSWALKIYRNGIAVA